MVFNQDEIEDAILAHFGTIFQGQRVPVYPTNTVDQVELTILELEQLLCQTTPPVEPDLFESNICSPYTFTDLDQTLQNLPNGKSSGYDCVPNEMLKNSSFHFKLYLQTILNRIIEDGEVPPDLNLGKCMLIYKVRINFLNYHNTHTSRVVIHFNQVSTAPSPFLQTFCGSLLSGCART